MKPPTHKGIQQRSAKYVAVAIRSEKPILPALLAIGGLVTALVTPVAAIELGEIQVESTLGQPLRASVTYALSPREKLQSHCISLSPGAASGLQPLTRARISVDGGRILLRGRRPVKEPMLALTMTVDCPVAAHIARDYYLMISPPGHFQAGVPAATIPFPRSESASRPGRQPAVAATVSTPPAAKNIEIGGDYRVRRGDTLSSIAGRLADRPIGLWPAVDIIFEANPDAFRNGNKNQLKTGVLLSIPAMNRAEAESTAAELTGTGLTVEELAVDGPTIEEPNVTEEIGQESFVADPQTFESSTTSAGGYEYATTESTGAEFEDDTAVLTSGESATVETNEISTAAVKSSIDSVTGMPDTRTELELPVAAESIDSGSWSLLMWLGGTGVALVLGLLLFGRKIRLRFGGDSTGNAVPVREVDDEITQEAPILADVDDQFSEEVDLAQESTMDADIGLDSDTRLDADLGIGSGLRDGTDMDVSQDFGFSADGNSTSHIDLELPEEDSVEPEIPSTDIIAPHVAVPDSILDSEIPPSDDDDSQYDLSMIVDATKQALDDAVGTTKDLMAVQLSMVATNPGDDYTLSREIDYKILEQDYEEELTATQALSEELANAALKLAERMNADNDDFIDDDDNARSDEELTVEMPSNDDNTVEMDVDTSTVDTKKLAR